jgi:hypothetical protein
MKTFYYSIFIIFFSISVLFADQIILKDASAIEGKILQITDKNIEYKQENGHPFLIISKDLVLKIKYDNGDILEITEGKLEQLLLSVENKPEINIEKNFVQSGGFIDSCIRLGLLGGFGIVWGNLHEKEKHAYDCYRNQLHTYPIYPSDDNPTIDYYNWDIGFETALMLPAYKTQQDGLYGIKFGIICNYTFSGIHQYISDKTLKNTDYSGALLKYRTINMGAEMDMIVGPKSDNVNPVLRFYFLGGYIHNGKLTALPGLRDAGLTIDKSEYLADFTGYSATIGTGIYFVSNFAPMVTGIDLQYTYSKIIFDHNVAVYNRAKGTSFDDIRIMFSVGIHF